MNAVARRLSGGDAWVDGSPCLVNAVATVEGLVVVIHGLVAVLVW